MNLARRLTVIVVVVVVFALLGAALFANGCVGSSPSAAVASPAALSGVHVFGWGFHGDGNIVSNGADVWLLNSANSVVELSAATGGLVRVIYGTGHEFDEPVAMAEDGVHLWVLNAWVTTSQSYGGSIAEINVSDGRLVRLIHGSNYEFADPRGIASDGVHVWVTNPCDIRSPSTGCLPGSVTEISAVTGRLIRVISGSTFEFGTPMGIAVSGGHVWVTNGNGNSVTELSASDGSLVKVINAVGPWSYDTPWGMGADRDHVWVGNSSSHSITEINSSTGRIVRVISGASNGFSNPSSIASDGVDVWVLSCCNQIADNSVTELSASTGTLVRVISGRKYVFAGPTAVVSDGTHVWLANPEDNHGVVEMSAPTGALIRLIRGSRYGFSGPIAIAADGAHIWVANSGRPGEDTDSYTYWGANSLAELNASNGRLVRVVTSPKYRFNYPDAVTVTGGHVWVVNGGTGAHSVTELDASNGALVRVISGRKYQFKTPTAIASDGAHIWVMNYDGDSVTELNASTGHLVGVRQVGHYPVAIASDGVHIWVASQGPPGSVTELNASTGDVIKVIAGSSYQLGILGAITSDGTHVWVGSYSRGDLGTFGGWLTEIDAATGQLIKVISASSYEFNEPDAMTTDGTRIWVANNNDNPGDAPHNSITELNASTGDLLGVMSAPKYGLSAPDTICLQDTHVWVANGYGQSVTEFPAG